MLTCYYLFYKFFKIDIPLNNEKLIWIFLILEQNCKLLRIILFVSYVMHYSLTQGNMQVFQERRVNNSFSNSVKSK